MAKETETQAGMSLTADQLQSLITAAVTAAVAESKKPAPLTEQQQAEILQANNMRLEQRDLVLQGEANKAALRRACSHFRSAAPYGTTAVYVQNGNYLICQQCQAVVRPGVEEKYKDSVSIYDTELFNKLFQAAGSGATF
jgi:hypothetical protein